MSISNQEKEFVSYVVEQMQSMGPVTAKRMFGGHGIFLERLMFALVADSELYLKVDKETEQAFLEHELGPFCYQKKGKEFTMSYYKAPEEVFDNPEDMLSWANKAYGAALRSKSKKSK